MPISRTAAIVLNAEGKPIKPSDVAQASNISTGQASTELARLVKMGIARKIGRGEYILLDKQKAVDFLNDVKHNNTTKDTMGVCTGPPEVFVRPHRLWFRAKVQNAPIIKGAIHANINRLDGWRVWEPNQNSKMYEKMIELPSGIFATVRYCEGARKRSMTVKCDEVLVKGNTLQDHLRDINLAVEAGLRKLCRDDGFQIGLITLSCDHHFAVPLPVTEGWRLPPPGVIPLNEFWWIDNSNGWPEAETHLVAQAKRLVELPDKVDALPAAVRDAIREIMAEYIGGGRREFEREPPQPGTGEEVA